MSRNIPALSLFVCFFSSCAPASAVTLNARAGFEQNRGQFPPSVLYALRPGAYLTSNALVLSPDQVVMSFEGSLPASRVLPSDPLPYLVNIFSGSNPQQWRTGIQRFGQIEYENIYPGIDVVFGAQDFAFRFVVAPGADPSKIHLAYSGTNVTTGPYGGGLLLLWLKTGRIGQNSVAYQDTRTGRTTVNVGFTFLGTNRFAFAIEGYDPAFPVTIETTLPLTSSSGGAGAPLRISRSGAIYTTWAESPIVTKSGDYTNATEPVNEVCGIGSLNYTQACQDVAVAKYSASGDLLYISYLRGTREESPAAIAVDQSEGVYITGITNSLDFPVTSGASQLTYAGPPPSFLHNYPEGQTGGDIFVAKLDGKTGVPLYSTYLGGTNSDSATSIHIDDAGNAYVAGPSNPDLPVTPGALQSTPCVHNPPPGTTGTSQLCQLGFVAKVGLGGAVSWLTQLPPTPTALTVDSQGNTYFGGSSEAGTGVFIAKLNASGSALAYSKTYTNYAASGVDDIAVDSHGSVWFSGPGTPGVMTSWIDGYYHGFLARLSASSSQVLYETPFIGKLAVDPNDNLSIYTQWHGSSIVRTPGGLLNSICAPVMISKLASNGSVLLNRPVTITNAIGFTWDANLIGLTYSGNGTALNVIPIAAASPPDLSCMVNAASLSVPDNVAPGEIVTILGRGLGPQAGIATTLDSTGKVPRALAGVQVLIDGVPVPILYADASQVNAIVPFSLTPGGTATIQLNFLGAKTAPVPVKVAEAQPELFTLDGSGAGQVLAINEDGALNGPANPARLGSIITVFATGTGTTSPPSEEGTLATGISARRVGSTAITLGGPIPTEVLYAGFSPGSLTSVTQFNVRLPSSLPPNSNWPLSAWPIFAGTGPLTQIATVALAR